MKLTLVLVAAFAACANAIPIENEVSGEPEIECGPTSISVTIGSTNNFEGWTYVKNMFADESCRVQGDGARPMNRIELPHDSCDVVRTRSADPKGVFMTTTIIHTFHPRFLTKVDRAYTIQCFYMEADKTVSTDIEVSMITTGFQTQFVPMPICRYQILEGADPASAGVQFAIIGQPVFHHWICDTDTVDTFCMTVHSCYVDDGAGDRLDLLLEDGCAFDNYLIGNLDYPEDLRALKEVHVFKYADRPALRFQCQISILVKDPNEECARPVCDTPKGGGDGDGQPGFRQKRHANEVAEMDVSSNTIEALDISPNMNNGHLPFFTHEGAAAIASENHSYQHFMAGSVARGSSDAYCVSPTAFATGLGVMVVIVVAVAVAAVQYTGGKQ